ncbi:MAG: hypothetical protein AB1710_05100 [Pseudomonadota bacterium]
MQPQDLRKTREICFNRLPPGQPAQAVQALSRVKDLAVRPSSREHCVLVDYHIQHHTLNDLEHTLASRNFHLDNSLLSKIRRAVVSYAEEVQRDNLNSLGTEDRTRPIYVRIYEHHAHGDHDETPEEWREYR